MRKQVKITTGKARLHIRSGPSISYKIVGYLYNGDTRIVDKKKTLSNGQVWYRIEGTTTWIAQNDPVKGESGYYKIIKDLEEKKTTTEKVKDEPVKEDKSSGNDYKLNDNMNGKTKTNTGGSDNTSLGSAMKGDSTGVSLHDPVVISKSNSYSNNDLKKDMVKIRKNLNIGNPSYTGIDTVVPQMFKKFNRWNTAFPDYHLMKTHVKIFFTRPDLNILTASSTMHDQASIDPLYRYIYENQPLIIRNLTKYASSKHQFNPLISNNPKSFEISDEYIKTVEAGETFTGYKIFYGRNDIESKAAGEISVNYIDDYNLDIFKTHKIWVDYISKVYRGEFSPKVKYKQSKTLDYAVALYYFVLGPDGETILFWSKYTGVFPTNTSSSALSWDKDTVLKMPEINIKYVYSIKRDLDPTHLAEFNTLSSDYSSASYAKNYEPDNLSFGRTWVGAPFVISAKNASGNVIYKLKFRPE